jgi:hypothetical protein
MTEFFGFEPLAYSGPTKEKALAAIAAELGLEKYDHNDDLAISIVEIDRLRGGPQKRHAARIRHALLAATHFSEWVHSVAEEGDPGSIRAGAALTLALDEYGIGGRNGVTGDSTDRHTAFRICGTGRKKAQDGESWSAAIREARWVANDEGKASLVVEAGWECEHGLWHTEKPTVLDSTPHLRIRIDYRSERDADVLDCPPMIFGSDWMRSMIHAGLRLRSAGKNWHYIEERTMIHTPRFDGPLIAWSDLWSFIERSQRDVSDAQG